MEQLNIGINGFGRIGRTLFRLLADSRTIKVTAINDLADPATLAHLLKYDSIHGPFNKNITHDNDGLIVEGNSVALYNCERPEDISWNEQNVDIVIEATGKFNTQKALAPHVKGSVKKVILCSPPADDAMKMIVLGVNESILDENDIYISNASCTTNNAAPMIKVMHELCGVEQAYITTVHSYTSDQSLHDKPHRDLRRARAASQSIIPTTTGAAKALTKIFPELAASIGGCGIRVPVPNGSLTDITLNSKKSTSIEEINNTFKHISQNSLKNILNYTTDPIVSVDINNSCYSCTFDSQMTSVIGKMVKIIGWYDNETGYCSRIIDLINLLINKKYI